MTSPSPLIERDGATFYITLNNPERLNAIGFEEHAGLIEAIDQARHDENAKVIVLSGAGRAFCSGDYIKTGQVARWPKRLAHRQVELDVGAGPTLLNAVTTALRNLLRPTIALLHGYAVGAGYDLASSCDFRLATCGCRIGDPRIKLALWGAEGWSYKLPRLIGQTWVPPITWLGELMSGVEARDIGFVHQVYEDDAPIIETTRDFVAQIAALDPAAYRAIKADLLDSLDRSPFSALVGI